MAQSGLPHVSIHGRGVSYHMDGDGPAILLIHGMAGSSRTWKEVMPLLARSYTVIAPDLLGHGGSAKPLGEFVEQHPTIKILALSFLLLIGFTLIVEGLHQHIPKGYIYFAMGFSVFVEMLNLRMRDKIEGDPVKLRDPYAKENKKQPKAAAN